MRAVSLLGARLAVCLATSFILLFAQQTQQESQGRTAEPAKGEPAKAAAPKPETGLPGTNVPIAVDPKSYSIGPEDVVYIRVWREPDLSEMAAVRPDGMITMPLIGDVHAGGLTPEQLSSRIEEKLSKFINHPEVIVSVNQVRSKRYYVTGEVNRPGAYPMAVPVTVLQALTEAGGFKEFANTKKISILRGTKQFKFNYKDVVKGKRMDQNIVIENGDYIIVP